MRTLRERWEAVAPRTADVVLAAAFAAVVTVNIFTTAGYDGGVAGNVAGTIALTAPIAFRRRAPIGALVVFGVAAVVQTAALQPVPDIVVSIPSVWLMLYAAGAYAEGRDAFVGLGVGLVAIAAVSAIYDASFSDIVFPVAFFGFAPWLAGRAVGHRGALARELAEKAIRLEHERERRAEIAVAEERTRIARELHDVVAHSVSVMVIQAGGARRIVERDPERAREAAVLIEQSGREALMEMRRLLGVLRRGDEDLALSPQPTLEHLDALLERARAAGLPVELKVEGARGKLPAGVDLAAYRVVQESLTNALKHAGSAPTRVLVRYGRRDLELEIANDPAPWPVAARNGHDAEPGHGLAGMQERVSLVGGEILARPSDEGGFLVQARLPVTVDG